MNKAQLSLIHNSFCVSILALIFVGGIHMPESLSASDLNSAMILGAVHLTEKCMQFQVTEDKTPAKIGETFRTIYDLMRKPAS